MRDRNQRLQEILTAASRVFIHKGFRATKMEEIATAAHMAVGTLYHYFPSKERLFASILAESTRILAERLSQAARKRVPPGLGLVAIARAYVDYFVEFPEYFHIQMAFQHEGPGEAGMTTERRELDALARQNLELFAEKIHEGQVAGVFRQGIAPMAAAAALWTSYNGILFGATSRPLLHLTGLSVAELLSAGAFLQFAGLNTDASTAPAMPLTVGESASEISLADVRETMHQMPWIDPAAIFAGMHTVFQKEKAAGVSEVYRFEFTGERGGSWTVVIEDGSIELSKDSTREPTVTLEMSDRRFIDLVTGEIDPIELIVSGELKITGSLQSAARLQSFFLADPRVSLDA